MDTGRYIAVKGHGSREMGRYQDRCKKEHLPVVTIFYRKTKYAVVSMDLIFVQGSQDYNENREFTVACIRVIEHFTRRSFGDAIQPGLYTHIRKVPIENATQLAEELLVIYDEYKSETTECDQQ